MYFAWEGACSQVGDKDSVVVLALNHSLVILMGNNVTMDSWTCSTLLEYFSQTKIIIIRKYDAVLDEARDDLLKRKRKLVL
jgi:hypothetical protein